MVLKKDPYGLYLNKNSHYLSFISFERMSAMPNPFFIFLKKEHTVPKLTSYTDTEHARELQLLVTAENNAEYRKKEAEYKQLGEKFRLTKGIVYEMKDEEETVKVKIALQVKGGSLTWYFWAPGAMDQYPQEFRDQLYNAAALAHKEVKNGCDYYYRGSNAVHIKLMHHLETESNHNHNHYRLMTGMHYTPEDFRQHLEALGRSEVYDIFFEEGEIETLCGQFKDFYDDWTAKAEGRPSKEEEYFSSPSQQLILDDLVELNRFGAMQEPCRINASELKVDFEAARRAIELSLRDEEPAILEIAQEKLKREYEEFLDARKVAGSRGLNSVIASTRQIEGSENPVVPQVMSMDDSLGKKEVADIPEWASSVLKAIDVSKKLLLSHAKARTVSKSEEQAMTDLTEHLEVPEQEVNLAASTPSEEKTRVESKQSGFVKASVQAIEERAKANVEGVTLFSTRKKSTTEETELDNDKTTQQGTSLNKSQ
jgi:hypothetical protein